MQYFSAFSRMWTIAADTSVSGRGKNDFGFPIE